MAQTLPSRATEKELLARYSRRAGRSVNLAGVDEVGRGAIAGPVGVGICVVDANTDDGFPCRLRDSKLLSPRMRQNLAEPCIQWVKAAAVGYAEAPEIDRYGIVGAMQIAAARAAEDLQARGITLDLVLLDGSHDWWSAPTLFADMPLPPALPVQTEVKGDARCAVVAAASVLAKVGRDKIMEDLSQSYPAYGWEKNKGYATKAHIAGIGRAGLSAQHRKSWKIPGVKQGGSDNNRVV